MGNQSCKIDNGEGEKGFWFWSECKVKECDFGYEETDGKCTNIVVLSGPCTPNSNVANAVTYVYNTGGVCVVEKCETGYVLQDGKCTQTGSGLGSGSGCTTTSQCASPYKCLVSNVAANKPRCLTVESCAQSAEQEDSLENNCYGQPIIRGYSPSIHYGGYGKGDGASINSVEACRLYAGSKSGATGFTWRNSSHGALPNTCVTYGGMPVGATATDYDYKNMHSSGCVDKTKKFPNCS
jgi:hypothetical protein